MVAVVNGVKLYNIEYTLNSLIKLLKEKGRYYKCRVCGRRYVSKENELCENCKYFAGLKIKEKKGSEKKGG